MHIAGRAYDTGHVVSRQHQSGSERGSGFKLGSQRSQCHDTKQSGVVGSSEGVERTGRLLSTADMY